MKVSQSVGPITMKNWYLDLEDAPEFDFDGKMLPPTFAIVSERFFDGQKRTSIHLESAKSAHILSFVSFVDPLGKANDIAGLPLTFQVALAKACTGSIFEEGQ